MQEVMQEKNCVQGMTLATYKIFYRNTFPIKVNNAIVFSNMKNMLFDSITLSKVS